MVAHKTKTLSLPHLSLSRTSANSRTSTPTTTPTSTTPTPTDDTPPFAPPFDRKKSKSSSPKPRILDPLLPLEKSLSRDPLKDKDKRRSSFGASLSTFSSAGGPRSSSPAPKSPSTPAGLTLTPASGIGAGGRSISESSTSGGVGGGLKPLRAVIAKSVAANGHGGDAGGPLPVRSKSSDRFEEKERKKGVMGAVRGLALGHSVSQPGSSRSASSGLGTGGGAHEGLVSSAGAGSPVFGGGATPGTATPSVAASSTAGQPQLHQLAESYVSKVSLRLGEAVNRVFLPGQGGVAGAQADKLEGIFFVGAAAAQGAFGGKGRASPRVVRSREVGELVFSELQAALHDHYLLRTLLRSSVLKALSLFLTRLSALLLVPSSPSEPLFLAPLSLSSPLSSSSKDPDFLFASHFPLPLRYNLHIVRCASEVKRHLLRVADPANEFPSFVEETLRPWRVKLGELIARVMGPVVAGYRLAVSEACAKARVEGASADGNEGAGAAAGGEALGLQVPKPSATSQLRSLSLGRGAPAAAGSTPSSADHLHAVAAAGPSWLREATAVLDVAAKLFVRLDAKGDADKWAVSIATAAVWKGMLGCAARVISAPEDESTAQVVVAPQPTAASTARNRILGGAKKTPSPPASPDLPSVDLAAPASSIKRLSPPASSAIAFVRLISDLELLEQCLCAFLTASLSSPSTVFAPAAPPPGACPGGGACGLCKTGRTFDPESDSSSDEDDELPQRGLAAGRESRLALSAMREAMQALSAMIVVVRASKDLHVLGAALSSSSTAVAAPAPLTPSALFALPPSPSPSPHTTTTALPSTSVTLTSLSPVNSHCATLHSALLELPPLILLHLVLSRVPRTLGVRLPHELWALRGGWREYEGELRGFAAGEEWAGEVGWEVRGEVARVEGERTEERWTEREREAVAVLKAALAKVGAAME
ncbi:hypothetical protein JCM1841_000101 [Sporobolomyces salmonicolor]